MKEKICKVCGECCVTVSDLTNEMCCHCYEVMRQEIRLANIESEHDYYNGDGLY